MLISVRKTNIFLSYLIMSLLAIPIFKAPFWGTSYTAIMATVIGTWLITAIWLDSKAMCSNLLQLQVWLLLVFYIGCSFINIGTVRNVLISVTTPWCPMIIFLFYVNRKDYAGLRIIVKCAFITLSITMATTLYGLITNTYLSRIMSTLDTTSRRIFMYQNIGDIGYVYVAGLLFTLMESMLFTSDKCITKKARYVLRVVALISAAIVIIGSSGITLMAVAISSICIMLYAVKNQKLRIVLILIVLITGLLVYVSGALENFFIQMSKNTNNIYLSSKFASIADTIGTGSATGDLGARIDRYSKDWNVFLNSFGFGVGPYYGGSGNTTTVYIAEHSQLLADLSRYGIAFFVYMLILHKHFFVVLKKIAYDCGIHYRILPVLICYLMMYGLQPIMQQQIIGYFVFLVWPALPLVFTNRSITGRI